MILCYFLLRCSSLKALAHAASIMNFIRGQQFTLQAWPSRCLWLQ